MSADSPAELVEALYEMDVNYVVWASREGLRSEHTRDNKAGLPGKIDHLQHGADVAPCGFIVRLGSQGQYVHVFKLLRPVDDPGPGPA